MIMLKAVLNELKKVGYRIAVISWLAKDATREYDNAVREAKRNWLAEYEFPYDEVHLVRYGTTKANAVRYKTTNAILIDDNEKIRKGWKLGETIDGSKNFLQILEKMLDEMGE